MAKGQDLQDASRDVEALQDSSKNLKDSLTMFSDRLEQTRERIEGASRLHHLLSLHLKEEDVQNEMQKLAEKIGVSGLIEKCKENISRSSSNYKLPMTSTPKEKSSSIGGGGGSGPVEGHCDCWRNVNDHMDRTGRSSLPRSIDGGGKIKCHDDDEEDHSKMADSGLGYCERCDGNEKLIRTCSCQSFEDPTNTSSKR